MLEKQKLQDSCANQIVISNGLNQAILLLKQKITSLDASLVKLQNDYDESKKELEKVNVLTASLKAHSEEQENIIVDQEKMIKTLMTGRPSKTAGSLGLFAKKASVTNDATATNHSPKFH